MSSFITFESKIERPIMPLRILKLRSLTATSVVRGLSFSAMFSVFFFGALYMEKVLGYGPLQTGVAFLPMSLTMAIMSLGITSRLLIRYGPMKLLVPGMSAVIVGLLLLTHTTDQSNYVTSILPAFLLLGLGMSISAVPLLTIAMADVPKSDAGLASGIVNVSMWLASSVALAVFGTLATSRTASLVTQGINPASALVAGYHVAFLIGAIFVAVGLVITVVVLRAPAREVVQAQSSPSESFDMNELEVFAGEF
jgi:MFS family permease